MGSKNKNVLVTGASGYVGMKVCQDLKNNGCKVFGTYYKNKTDDDFLQVDLTDQSQVVDLLEKINPDVIVHLAADAHSKTCEENPEYARKINVDSTRYLVDIARKKNIRMIHLSTFACFNPSNVYGKTKYEAEQIVQELENYVIVRASLIVGLSPNARSKNYFNDLIQAVKNKTEIEADKSWEFEMTSLGHLSEVIVRLVERDDIKNIMIPVIERGVTSRYKIASKIASSFGISVKPVDQNRVIPLPDFDKDILKRLSLPDYTYGESIEKIINKLIL